MGILIRVLIQKNVKLELAADWEEIGQTDRGRRVDRQKTYIQTDRDRRVDRRTTDRLTEAWDKQQE